MNILRVVLAAIGWAAFREPRERYYAFKYFATLKDE